MRKNKIYNFWCNQKKITPRWVILEQGIRAFHQEIENRKATIFSLQKFMPTSAGPAKSGVRSWAQCSGRSSNHRGRWVRR